MKNKENWLKWDWRVSRRFVIFYISFFFLVGLAILLLSTLNPQICRFIYIYQSIFVKPSETVVRAGFSCDNGPMPAKDYSGVWYRWHLNGRRSSEEHYIDGRLDGPYRAWDTSGFQFLETAYRANQYHGDFVLLNDNHSTNVFGHYVDGKSVGHWQRFYEDGRKLRESFFSAPGVRDGEEVTWNTNGVVISTRVWNKGKPWDGKFELYRGTNWFREKYEAGRLISSIPWDRH